MQSYLKYAEAFKLERISLALNFAVFDENFAIIIPAFNEKQNLEILTKHILKILPSANIQ